MAHVERPKAAARKLPELRMGLLKLEDAKSTHRNMWTPHMLGSLVDSPRQSADSAQSLSKYQ